MKKEHSFYDFPMKIRFNVPDTYSRCPKIRKSTEDLPDWDNKTNKSEFSNYFWEMILDKIRENQVLSERETLVAVQSFQLLPNNLKESLTLILKKSNPENLKSLIRELNQNFSQIDQISFLLSIPELSNFLSKNLLPGIFFLRDFVTREGWVGLLNGVLSWEKVTLKILKENFIDKKSGEIESSYLISKSFINLIEGLVEYDKNTVLFKENVIDFLYLTASESLNKNICFSEDEDRQKSLISKFDRYLGVFLNKDLSWEVHVISDDYVPVKLVYLFYDKFKLGFEQLPSNARRVIERRKGLESVIDAMNREEPDRGRFWKEYMPFADQIILKQGNDKVAVAFYFKNYVIVEFAPKGNAAYVYRRGIFEKYLSRASNPTIEWKSKEHGLYFKGVTRDYGDFYHIQGWQSNLAKFLDRIIEVYL